MPEPKQLTRFEQAGTLLNVTKLAHFERALVNESKMRHNS